MQAIIRYYYIKTNKGRIKRTFSCPNFIKGSLFDDLKNITYIPPAFHFVTMHIISLEQTATKNRIITFAVSIVKL